MQVNPRSKAAKLLRDAGADPLFENIQLEVEKRAELISESATGGPHVYQFTDLSQIELIPSLNIARVVQNAEE